MTQQDVMIGSVRGIDAVVAQRAQKLPEEKGVAAGCGVAGFDEYVSGRSELALDTHADTLARQWSRLDTVASRGDANAAQELPELSALAGPGSHEHNERFATGPGDELPQPLQRRDISPMCVVDDDRDRRPARQTQTHCEERPTLPNTVSPAGQRLVRQEEWHGESGVPGEQLVILPEYDIAQQLRHQPEGVIALQLIATRLKHPKARGHRTFRGQAKERRFAHPGRGLQETDPTGPGEGSLHQGVDPRALESTVEQHLPFPPGRGRRGRRVPAQLGDVVQTVDPAQGDRPRRREAIRRVLPKLGIHLGRAEDRSRSGHRTDPRGDVHTATVDVIGAFDDTTRVHAILSWIGCSRTLRVSISRWSSPAKPSADAASSNTSR